MLTVTAADSVTTPAQSGRSKENQRYMKETANILLPGTAIPQAIGEPAPAITPAPVWNTILGWSIVLPLLFLSANGALFPQSGDPSFGATGGSPESSASHMIGVAIVTLICSVLIASQFSLVLSACGRMKVVLGLPVLAVLSSAWSVQPRKSVVSGIILLVFTVFCVYVGTRFSFKRQFELIMLVGAVALPVSIALALFVPSLGASSAGWRGVFGHKQNCAAVCMLWLITALHWKCSGIYQKIFRLMYIVMCVVMIGMSQSRTGWALTLVALVLSAGLWILQKMPAKEALLISLLTLPCAGALAYAVFRYSSTLAVSVGKDPTLSQRTTIWAAVWDAILNHPIVGYGFVAFWNGLYGASQNVVLTSGWAISQAQNGFLDVWLGVGAIGVALIAIMVVQSMRNVARCFETKDTQVYVRWSIVVILTVLLYNVGESSLGLLHMVWFLFLLAYIGLSESALKAQTI
jgi:exopolysaccharide production protein ExoQ